MKAKIHKIIANSIYTGSPGFNGYDEATEKMEKLFTQALIEENESILEMAKTHMDSRAVLVITDRINYLKSKL